MTNFSMNCTTCGSKDVTTGAIDLIEWKQGRMKPYGTPRSGCPNHPVQVRIYRLGEKDYPNEQNAQAT